MAANRKAALKAYMSAAPAARFDVLYGPPRPGNLVPYEDEPGFGMSDKSKKAHAVAAAKARSRAEQKRRARKLGNAPKRRTGLPNERDTNH